MFHNSETFVIRKSNVPTDVLRLIRSFQRFPTIQASVPSFADKSKLFPASQSTIVPSVYIQSPSFVSFLWSGSVLSSLPTLEPGRSSGPISEPPQSLCTEANDSLLEGAPVRCWQQKFCARSCQRLKAPGDAAFFFFFFFFWGGGGGRLQCKVVESPSRIPPLPPSVPVPLLSTFTLHLQGLRLLGRTGTCQDNKSCRDWEAVGENVGARARAHARTRTHTRARTHTRM